MVRDARRCRAPHHEGLTAAPRMTTSSRGAAQRRLEGWAATKTGDTHSHSRSANAPKLFKANHPRETRGRRECRMRVAPEAACAAKKAHALATTGTPHQPAFPAQWF